MRSLELVKLIYDDQTLGQIATGRHASHLVEQLAVKSFVPVSADRNLASVNIPSVLRVPAETPIADARRCLAGCGGQGGSEPWAIARDAGVGGSAGGQRAVRF
jgi:hypothetical protein